MYQKPKMSISFDPANPFVEIQAVTGEGLCAPKTHTLKFPVMVFEGGAFWR